MPRKKTTPRTLQRRRILFFPKSAAQGPGTGPLPDAAEENYSATGAEVEITVAPVDSPQPPSGQPAPVELTPTDTGTAETLEPQPQLAAQAVAWQPDEQGVEATQPVLQGAAATQPVEHVLQPVEHVQQLVGQQRFRRSEMRRVEQQLLQQQSEAHPHEVPQLATWIGAAT